MIRISTTRISLFVIVADTWESSARFDHLAAWIEWNSINSDGEYCFKPVSAPARFKPSDHCHYLKTYQISAF